MRKTEFDLEDVLNAVMLEEEEPNYEALQRCCQRYPAYRESLARFFATWAIQSELPVDDTVDESHLANIGVSRALNILSQQESEMETPTVTLRGSRLLVVCRRAGISEEELANRTDLDRSIIAKLDLRRLSAVPGVCFERIARVLRTSVEFVMTLITGLPVVLAGARYKSVKRPRPKTEDFAAAVRSSSLGKTQRDFWLDAVRKEEERGGK
jgi:hypothetical protein